MRARYYAPGSEPSWWTPFETDTLGFIGRNPLQLQLDHFVEVVRGVAAPRVSAREGYMNMMVVEAIMRSINIGAAVELEEH